MLFFIGPILHLSYRSKKVSRSLETEKVTSSNVQTHICQYHLQFSSPHTPYQTR